MGLIAQQQAGLQMVAAAARLGRISANQLLALAEKGIGELVELQTAAFK